MPTVPPTSSLPIQPGEAIGPLSLSSSLYSTLTTLLQHKSTFPRLNISFNSSNPVCNPIYIDLEANGLRLRFDGESQHLELIEVTEFGKLGLLYKDSNLSRHGPPSFKSIYNTFGPTSLGELLPATTSSLQMTYILSYPGIAFKFPVPKNASKFPTDKALVKVLHKNEPPCLATSFVIFAGNSWSEARAALGQPRLRTKIKKSKKQEKLCPEDTDQLDFAEIIPNDRVLLTFQSGNTVALTYGTFTAQDAVTLLGPPSEVYTKSDTRLNIHNGHTRSDEIDSGSLSEASEYFYNYFSYGLSLLFSPSQTHTLQKILLHANLPASHCFHRFSRIQWILFPTGATNGASRKNDANQEVLTSEMNFDEIKTSIEKVSEPSGRPMIVNRGGQGSPSSSIELVSDNILTATPFGCTDLFGFSAEGLVFEVIEGGWVGQVTCFKA